MTGKNILPYYYLKQGSTLDRALLIQFLQRTYQELCPHTRLSHLANTAEQYFSGQTPVWWVEWQDPQASPQSQASPGLLAQIRADYSKNNWKQIKVGCLWMGIAVDQCQGDRHSHIFLLYVDPLHRRQGIGRELMKTAEEWAKRQGDRQITLQVFTENQTALSLYRSMGYEDQAITLVKRLST